MKEILIKDTELSVSRILFNGYEHTVNIVYRKGLDHTKYHNSEKGAIGEIFPKEPDELEIQGDTRFYKNFIAYTKEKYSYIINFKDKGVKKIGVPKKIDLHNTETETVRLIILLSDHELI